MKSFSRPRQRAFLAAYADPACAGSITKSASAAKIDRGTHYDWMEFDPTYPARLEAAARRLGDLLEEEAIRRAHTGVLEPVVYHGRFQFHGELVTREDGSKEYVEDPERPLAIRKYSDRLLEKLLSAFKPEKYRERHELSGPGGGPIQSEHRLIFVDPQSPPEASAPPPAKDGAEAIVIDEEIEDEE